MVKKTKSGLGKGLDRLIPTGDTEKEEKQNDPVMLKTSQIEPNKNQPRKQFDSESLAELTESVKQYGIIQPIIVNRKDDYYEIIAGERRWRAAKAAGLKEVPVVIKEYSDREIAEISLIENIQREDLNPIEAALGYKQLIEDYQLTQEELAQRISKSRALIANTMRLLNLHKNVQKMLIKGELTAGHARALLAIEDKNEQLATAQKIIEGALSVRAAEDLVRKMLVPKAENTKTEKIKNDAIYKNLEKTLTESMKTKVRIQRKTKEEGKIEISYFSEDELDRLYTVINSAFR